MTLIMIQGVKKNFYNNIVIAKRLKYDMRILCYGTERKVGVMLRCTLAMRYEKILKIAIVRNVPNILSYFSAKYYPFELGLKRQHRNFRVSKSPKTA